MLIIYFDNDRDSDKIKLINIYTGKFKYISAKLFNTRYRYKYHVISINDNIYEYDYIYDRLEYITRLLMSIRDHQLLSYTRMYKYNCLEFYNTKFNIIIKYIINSDNQLKIINLLTNPHIDSSFIINVINILISENIDEQLMNAIYDCVFCNKKHGIIVFEWWLENIYKKKLKTFDCVWTSIFKNECISVELITQIINIPNFISYDNLVELCDNIINIKDIYNLYTINKLCDRDIYKYWNCISRTNAVDLNKFTTYVRDLGRSKRVILWRNILKRSIDYCETEFTSIKHALENSNCICLLSHIFYNNKLSSTIICKYIIPMYINKTISDEPDEDIKLYVIPNHKNITIDNLITMGYKIPKLDLSLICMKTNLNFDMDFDIYINDQTRIMYFLSESYISSNILSRAIDLFIKNKTLAMNPSYSTGTDKIRNITMNINLLLKDFKKILRFIKSNNDQAVYRSICWPEIFRNINIPKKYSIHKFVNYY